MTTRVSFLNAKIVVVRTVSGNSCGPLHQKTLLTPIDEIGSANRHRSTNLAKKVPSVWLADWLAGWLVGCLAGPAARLLL